jgi:hypothetical protein
MARVMAGRRIRYTRQSPLFYQVFVCLRPRWDRFDSWGPVGVRGLVAPFHETRHNLRVRFGTAKRLHGCLTLPNSQGPERTTNIYEQSSAKKSRSAHDLALRKQRLPQERRKKPHRPNTKTRDRSEHGLNILSQSEFGPDGKRLFWRVNRPLRAARSALEIQWTRMFWLVNAYFVATRKGKGSNLSPTLFAHNGDIHIL